MHQPRSDSKAQALFIVAGLCLLTLSLQAADWPQWRGPNRDAKAAGLEAPKTWPTALAHKWKVVVGPGDATPALVGDKLYGPDPGLYLEFAEHGWTARHSALPGAHPYRHG